MAMNPQLHHINQIAVRQRLSYDHRKDWTALLGSAFDVC
jgi:hypothetical protein